MSATRQQMLQQAGRCLDLAFLLAENGDHFGAANNMNAAKALIFPAQSTQPPSRSVADHRQNTGSGCACSEASLA